jgi:hypothetical protein
MDPSKNDTENVHKKKSKKKSKKRKKQSTEIVKDGEKKIIAPLKSTRPKKRKKHSELMTQVITQVNKDRASRIRHDRKMREKLPLLESSSDSLRKQSINRRNVNNQKNKIDKDNNNNDDDDDDESLLSVSRKDLLDRTNSWQTLSTGEKASAIKTYAERYATSNFVEPLQSIQRKSLESLSGISRRLVQMTYAMEMLRFGIYEDPAMKKCDDRYKSSLVTLEKHSRWIKEVGMERLSTCVQNDMPRVAYMEDGINSFIREVSHDCRDIIDAYPNAPPNAAVTVDIFSRQPTSRAKGRKKKGKNSSATSRSAILSNRSGRGTSTNRSGGASSRSNTSASGGYRGSGGRGNGANRRGDDADKGGNTNQRSRRTVGIRPTLCAFTMCMKGLNHCPGIIMTDHTVLGSII